MQHKIQRMQVGQLVTLNLAQAEAGKMPLYALRRHLADQGGVMLRPERDQADVGVISLVARACMRDFPKLYLHFVPGEKHFLLRMCADKTRIKYFNH
jgi:hypothetical protein